MTDYKPNSLFLKGESFVEQQLAKASSPEVMPESGGVSGARAVDWIFGGSRLKEAFKDIDKAFQKLKKDNIMNIKIETIKNGFIVTNNNNYESDIFIAKTPDEIIEVVAEGILKKYDKEKGEETKPENVYNINVNIEKKAG